MGSIGVTEMIVIFVIALLVFGPKKLPELGKSLGKGIREFRKHTEELKSSWDDQMRDVEAPLKDVSRDIQETAQDVKNDFYQSIEPKESNESSAPSASSESGESSESAPANESSPENEPAVPKEHV